MARGSATKPRGDHAGHGEGPSDFVAGQPDADGSSKSGSTANAQVTISVETHTHEEGSASSPVPYADVEFRTVAAPLVPAYGGRREQSLPSTSVVQSSVTDDQGFTKVALTSIAKGSSLLVRATRAGFIPSEELVHLGQTDLTIVRLRLRPGIQVGGRVTTVDQTAVGGITVVAIPTDLPLHSASRGVAAGSRVGWSRTTTAKNGGFTFTLNPGTEYRVRAQSARWIQAEPLLLRPSTDEAAARADLTVFPARLFRVRLVDAASGDPIWKAHVCIRPEDATARFDGYEGGILQGSHRFDGHRWFRTMSATGGSRGANGLSEGLLWWQRESDIPSDVQLAITGVLGYQSTVAKVTLQDPAAQSGRDDVPLVRNSHVKEGGTLVVTEDPSGAPHREVTAEISESPSAENGSGTSFEASGTIEATTFSTTCRPAPGQST